MNRAEIRRQKRQEEKGEGRIYITKSQLDRIVAEATDKALDKLMLERLEQNITVMMSLPLVSLHDRFGFGPKRTRELLDDMMVKWDCMNEDYKAHRREGYSFDTFVNILKEEKVIDIVAYLNERAKEKEWLA
jgi:hypothetical protein